MLLTKSCRAGLGGLLFISLVFVSPCPISTAQDTIEFLNGTTMQCKILEIRKDAKEFAIETQIGSRTIKRTYPYSQVHAVTYKGKRFELTKKGEADSQGRDSHIASNPPTRTAKEIIEIIDAAGATPPDWFSITELDVPDTLDFDWPLKADGGWNNQKNVGQYIWDIVNPNEHRWQSGIKLVHQCMTLHKEDPALLNRDIGKLAEMYFTLLQDYPRAAFWFRKIDAQANRPAGVHLAECYWRLGSKEMAMAMLRGSALPLNAIKLLGDMGEVDEALRFAKAYAESQAESEAYLLAGDALRNANRLDEAIEYYELVLASETTRNAEYKKRYQGRANDSIEAIRLFDKAEAARVADGTYRDSSTGYNGPLAVEVKVSAGKIETIKVVSHQEKQFYAALTDTPMQIVDKQSVRDIDGTSGATITSQAVINATARALAKGAR